MPLSQLHFMFVGGLPEYDVGEVHMTSFLILTRAAIIGWTTLVTAPGRAAMASPRGKLAFFSAYLRAALEGAPRLIYAAMLIVAPTNPWASHGDLCTLH